MKKVLVTGGAGFIGSHLIKLWLKANKNVSIINLDKLTYCGDLSRLDSIKKNPRYSFVRGDICDAAVVEKAMKGCDEVVHLAAETHVDRSLLSGTEFFQSNLIGTYVLLEMAKKLGVKKFLFVSTDEVYGSRLKGFFKETDHFEPTSPYSVSKTSADLLAKSFANAYGMHVVITRGANTYGSYQYPEKVIPLFVSNALSGQDLPLYGDGKQIRNWLHVEDHARGILCVLQKGKSGEAYNVCSHDYLENIVLTKKILKILGKSESLIKHVQDRTAHDKRYAMSNAKLTRLGWKAQADFSKELVKTVLWYRDNEDWWRAIKEKDMAFKEYYKKAYSKRLR